MNIHSNSSCLFHGKENVKADAGKPLAAWKKTAKQSGFYDLQKPDTFALFAILFTSCE